MTRETQVLLGEDATRIRARSFVGRKTALESLEALLKSDHELRLLFLQGIPGIGKTFFLREALRRAKERGYKAIYIDAASAPDSHQELGAWLQKRISPLVLSESSSEDRSNEHYAQNLKNEKSVHSTRSFFLAVDSFECISRHEAWIFNELFPSIPQNTRIVVAGRNLPDERLLADPGWNNLSTFLTLECFSTTETKKYLEYCGIDTKRKDEIHDLTRGHPLALALVRQILEQTPGEKLPPKDSEEYFQTLLKHFVQNIPSFNHRKTLWLSAMVPFVSQEIIRRFIEEEKSPILLDWLQELSFARVTWRGVTIHELVRDLLRKDLLWRDPQLYQFFFLNIAKHQLEAIDNCSNEELQSKIFDLAHIASIGAKEAANIYSLNSAMDFSSRKPTANDWRKIEEMVASKEGASALSLLKHWRKNRGDTVFFQSESAGEYGFLMILRLEEFSSKKVSQDPAVCSLHQWLVQKELMGNRPAVLCRFWMSKGSYQSSSTCRTFIFLHIIRYVLGLESPVCIFSVHRDPRLWLPYTQYAEIEHFDEFDFKSDGNAYGLFGRVFADKHAGSWMKKSVQKMFSMEIPDGDSTDSNCITRHDFDREIKKALRNYHHPDCLRDSLLLKCAFMKNKRGPNDNRLELSEKLAAELFKHSCVFKEKKAKKVYFDVLNETYFNPALKQRVAAENLCMSYGTYRRRLAEAIRHLAQQLWLHESSNGH